MEPIITLDLFYNNPNPLCIVKEQKIIDFPNMIDRFESDLYGIGKKLSENVGKLSLHHLTKMITMYYFELLIEFKDNFKGIIPVNYANDIYHQVIEAFINLYGDFLNISKIVPNYIKDGFIDINIFEEVDEYMSAL